MSEEMRKNTKLKQKAYVKRSDETKYYKEQKYNYPKKEQSYQKFRQPLQDQNFLKLMQNHPECFSSQKIIKNDILSIPIEDCLVILIKSENKIRKKSDFQKNAYQKPKYQEEEDEEKEPEWMQTQLNNPDINDFQLKTLEYEFKKVLNVKKSYQERLQTPLKDQELFADVDQQLEKQCQEIKGLQQDQSLDKSISDSGSEDISFEKLFQKSQLKNQQQIIQKPIEKEKTLDQNPIYPVLYLKCSQLYPQNKEYNKMKLFIDFTRQLTNLDINDNIWYYEDPQKKVQGPFSSVDMDVWNLDQYFPPNLQISWKQNKQFLSISNFKENPLQIVQIGYQQQESILQFLQIDKNENKKPPQGFENFNQLQQQILPPNNFLITQNNYQISQNNYQLPIFNHNNQFMTLPQNPLLNPNQAIGKTQIENQSSQSLNDFFKNFQQNQFIQNEMFQSQPQKQNQNQDLNQFQNKISLNQNFDQLQFQSLQKEPQIQTDFISNLLNDDPKKEKSKKIDIQSEPKDSNTNNNQINFGKLSESDLKRMLGIQNQNFFNF